MRKYALINNFTVTAIMDLEDESIGELAKVNQMIVDITDSNPQPQLNWVVNGNKLELPAGSSDREKMEIDLANRKTDFGIKLSRYAIDRIGARNKILNKNGTQVATLLNQLLSVKLLLETGALGTARYACMGLKVVYTEYTDIFDHVISEVNNFESNFGL